MDPSDGEQGRGDRMRVYDILGQAHAALGDQEQADFFAQVVQSIRISEEADQWRIAGLTTMLSRSIAKARLCLMARIVSRLAWLVNLLIKGDGRKPCRIIVERLS